MKSRKERGSGRSEGEGEDREEREEDRPKEDPKGTGYAGSSHLAAILSSWRGGIEKHAVIVSARSYENYVLRCSPPLVRCTKTERAVFPGIRAFRE